VRDRIPNDSLVQQEKNEKRTKGGERMRFLIGQQIKGNCIQDRTLRKKNHSEKVVELASGQTYNKKEKMRKGKRRGRAFAREGDKKRLCRPYQKT